MDLQLVPPYPAREPATRYDREGLPFDVRPYGPEDGAALGEFYDGFEPSRGAQGLPPTGRGRIDRWLRAVLPTGIHLVAARRGILIAHALVVPTTWSGVAEYALFVHQDERSRGVGSELTRAALDSARGAGILRLWLTVEPTNRPAIHTYERAGFRFRPATRYSAEAEMTLDLAG